MILDLHRQGLSVSAIARQLGVDRKTVRKYTARGYTARGLEPPRYGPAFEIPGSALFRLCGYTVLRLCGDAVQAISGNPFVLKTRLMPWRTSSWISSSSSKAIRFNCRCASRLR
jgi:hypothetical protein